MHLTKGSKDSWLNTRQPAFGLDLESDADALSLQQLLLSTLVIIHSPIPPSCALFALAYALA